MDVTVTRATFKRAMARDTKEVSVLGGIVGIQNNSSIVLPYHPPSRDVGKSWVTCPLSTSEYHEVMISC